MLQTVNHTALLRFMEYDWCVYSTEEDIGVAGTYNFSYHHVGLIQRARYVWVVTWSTTVLLVG